MGMLSEGKTSGVFQLESAGMTGVCVGLKPKSIEDICAVIALYRHSLNGHGGVDELFGRGVFVVGVLELFGQLQRVFQRNVQSSRPAGDQFG